MAGAVISGTVLSLSGGEPIVEARVYFVDAPGPMPDIAALTNEAGGFSLGAPFNGTYRIETAVEGFLAASKTVEVTGEQDEIRLVIELAEETTH